VLQTVPSTNELSCAVAQTEPTVSRAHALVSLQQIEAASQSRSGKISESAKPKAQFVDCDTNRFGTQRFVFDIPHVVPPVANSLRIIGKPGVTREF
jgi:hypothetical protein